MTKTYWNDHRPLPKPTKWECCDCRNKLEIIFIETYPHAPQTINYCPICEAKGYGVDPSWRQCNA